MRSKLSLLDQKKADEIALKYAEMIIANNKSVNYSKSNLINVIWEEFKKLFSIQKHEYSEELRVLVNQGNLVENLMELAAQIEFWRHKLSSLGIYPNEIENILRRSFYAAAACSEAQKNAQNELEEIVSRINNWEDCEENWDMPNFLRLILGSEDAQKAQDLMKAVVDKTSERKQLWPLFRTMLFHHQVNFAGALKTMKENGDWLEIFIEQARFIKDAILLLKKRGKSPQEAERMVMDLCFFYAVNSEKFKAECAKLLS